jgi:hypothetical protein
MGKIDDEIGHVCFKEKAKGRRSGAILSMKKHSI